MQFAETRQILFMHEPMIVTYFSLRIRWVRIFRCRKSEVHWDQYNMNYFHFSHMDFAKHCFRNQSDFPPTDFLSRKLRVRKYKYFVIILYTTTVIAKCYKYCLKLKSISECSAILAWNDN